MNGDVPVVTVGAVPATTTNATLSVHVGATDAQEKLRRLHVTDNGVAIFGAAGMPLDGAHTVVRDILIPLVRGPNMLKVVAENEVGIASIEESATVSYVGSAPKPQTYVVAAGITKYRDQSLNLTFPDKDAADVAAALASPNTVVLANEKATRQAILDTRKTLEQTTVDDTVVVYLSGHGTVDKSGTYYFAPHDIDVNRIAATGIAYRELEALLDRIPARKRLLILDSCNSGELRPR